jgi:beta-glucosidase
MIESANTRLKNNDMIRRFIPFAVVACLPVSTSWADEIPIYRDQSALLEQRVDALFQAMTPEERLTLLGGTGFTTQPVPRLGVPPMAMVDASQGVRGGSDSTQGKAASFGASVLLSSTWDPDLAGRVGHAIGIEALNKGTGAQILLGPGVNIMRAPLGGRNGEYLGEDPYHTSCMAVAYIKGLQETGCSACIKHYACNSQEFYRNWIDARVDERALREIYTPAFIAAVEKGKVWSVMSAYNQVNGSFSSANWYLQKNILKGEAGFDGLIMSDWGGVHSSLAIRDGCDLEMPNGSQMTPENIRVAWQAGDLTQADIDDAVKRVIRTIIRVGLMDAPRQRDAGLVDSSEHQQLALEVAEKGIVLLKNEKSILPLDPAKVHSIALIGPTCKGWQIGTTGSGKVESSHTVTAFDALVARAGSGVNITYSHGYDANYTGEIVPSSVLKPPAGGGEGLSGDYFAGDTSTGLPLASRIDSTLNFDFSRSEQRPANVPAEHFCARWTGSITAPATGAYRMNIDADDGARLFIDDKLVQDTWPGFDGSAIEGRVDVIAGQSYAVRIEYVQIDTGAHIRWTWLPPDQNLFAEQVDLAKKADVALVFVGSGGEGEFRDRRTLMLPGVQNEMIRAVAAANPHTVVVLNNGGPVLVSNWIDEVPGVIEALMPGESGGPALAAILFGDVNPSGKLVYTIAKKREDYPDFKHYPVDPGTFDCSGHANPAVDYPEGIYVGYRYFDKKAVAPSFPFGFGLSYTSFNYTNMKLSAASMAPADKITVSADITNNGPREGAEVAELYMRAKQPHIDRPIRELKGSVRVELKPGETKPVHFDLTARDLAYCDVPGKQWKADAGSYTLELGASSRDVRLTSEVNLDADYTLPLPGLGKVSPYATAPSLTTGKIATASSIQSHYTPGNAIDLSDESRWSSDQSDPQWLAVDLGQPTLFNHALIHWERAFARSYQLQTSDDGTNWNTIYTNQDAKGGAEKITFSPVTARWVRIYGTLRATGYGYSISNFQLFAPAN